MKYILVHLGDKVKTSPFVKKIKVKKTLMPLYDDWGQDFSQEEEKQFVAID